MAAHTHPAEHAHAAGAPAPADPVTALRAAGLRATVARVAVLQALAERGHGTPEELFEQVAARLVGVSLSTVYRTLESLGDHGVVNHTHLGGDARTWQLAGTNQHAHLVCRKMRQRVRGGPGRDSRARPRAGGLARLRCRHRARVDLRRVRRVPVGPAH